MNYGWGSARHEIRCFTHTYVQDGAVPDHCCPAAEWAEKEDGLRLCVVLLHINSDVAVACVINILDALHTFSTFLQDGDMRMTATAALAATTASLSGEKKQ